MNPQVVPALKALMSAPVPLSVPPKVQLNITAPPLPPGGAPAEPLYPPTSFNGEEFTDGEEGETTDELIEALPAVVAPKKAKPSVTPKLLTTSAIAAAAKRWKDRVTRLPIPKMMEIAEAGGFAPDPFVLTSSTYKVRDLDLGNKEGSHLAYLVVACGVALEETPSLAQIFNT